MPDFSASIQQDCLIIKSDGNLAVFDKCSASKHLSFRIYLDTIDKNQINSEQLTSFLIPKFVGIDLGILNDKKELLFELFDLIDWWHSDKLTKLKHIGFYWIQKQIKIAGLNAELIVKQELAEDATKIFITQISEIYKDRIDAIKALLSQIEAKKDSLTTDSLKQILVDWHNNLGANRGYGSQEILLQLGRSVDNNIVSIDEVVDESRLKATRCTPKQYSGNTDLFAQLLFYEETREQAVWIWENLSQDAVIDILEEIAFKYKINSIPLDETTIKGMIERESFKKNAEKFKKKYEEGYYAKLNWKPGVLERYGNLFSGQQIETGFNPDNFREKADPSNGRTD